MIDTLEDLAAYSRRVAQRFPSLAERTLLRSPGCSDADVDRLRASLVAAGR